MSDLQPTYVLMSVITHRGEDTFAPIASGDRDSLRAWITSGPTLPTGKVRKLDEYRPDHWHSPRHSFYLVPVRAITPAGPPFVATPADGAPMKDHLIRFHACDPTLVERGDTEQNAYAHHANHAMGRLVIWHTHEKAVSE